MKLLACHVENFGKLSDFYMEFTEGINVINESNAWGKSTLAAFLKAMFYGLDAKKDAKAFEKERTLYRPWQGGSFGGELDFEVEGRKYRISRSFGKTEKTDEFHLYDLSTNLECEDYSSNIGAELFDLDSNSFKRSIFIAQNDCATETSDGINAKVGNLAEHANDMNSFESASQRMRELLNKLTPDRITGSLKRRKNYITQLTQEMHTLGAAQEGYDGVLAKKKNLDEQVEELLRIRQNYREALVLASEDSRNQELYKQYDVLCADVNKKEEKLNKFHEKFPKGVPQMQEIEDQIQTGRIMEELNTSLRHYGFSEEEQKQWNKLEMMFREEKPSISTIDVAISTLSDADKLKAELVEMEAAHREDISKLKELENEQYTKKNGTVKIVVAVLLIMLLTAGVVGVLGFYNPLQFAREDLFQLLVVIIIAGVVLMGTVGGLMYASGKKKWAAWRREQDEKICRARDEERTLAESITQVKKDTKDVMITVSKFLEKYHVFCDTSSYQAKLYEMKNQLADYERLEEKNKGFFDLKEKYDAMNSHIKAFAEEYGITLGEDIFDDMNKLENSAIEYRLAREAYEASKEKRTEFENAREKRFWTKVARCPYSVEELNKMISQADAKLEELKEAELQYQKQLDDLQEQLDMRDEKAVELETQQQLQSDEMQKYNLVKLTHDFLQKAKEQFIAKYMGPIERSFGKYYYMLTGDNRGEWMMDVNMNLQVREYGELRDTHYLSAGYQDLIGVCMRLALVDAMYKEEKPFLVLDDPFMNLDQEKVERGNKFLMAVAKEYQVIYFTCHESRCPN